MKTKLMLFSLMALVCLKLYGQDRCATVYDPSKLTLERRQNIEEFYNRVDKIIQNSELQNLESQDATTNSFSASSGVILIPVVVHVVHNTTAENISNAQICSQIAALNEDFARRNADRTQTPAAFAGVAANTDIQFYLATRDPNGNATNGITRTATTRTSFPADNSVKSNATGGRTLGIQIDT
ncbi:MAG: hypothetical protein ACLFT3_18150 [Cyclobacteriaceae bacterium]